jgi:phosphatidylserine/phosphatidylglycerophosphate/cardiolipin synthase-like enzyme
MSSIIFIQIFPVFVTPTILEPKVFLVLFSHLPIKHQIDSVQLWSHHEKVVVVDNEYAAIGGLDLCFGRWDTHSHPLADVHPTDFSKTLFPGQDYNNARVMDFKEVGDYVSNALSIQDVPRMPWHDVSVYFFFLCLSCIVYV